MKAREGAVYQRLLAPLAVRCATVYTMAWSGSDQVLPMEDHGIVAIDGCHAELTPHLGDLYALLRDATRHGVAESEAHRAHFACHPVPDSAWHLKMGRLAWLIRGLAWASRAKSQVPGQAQLIAAMTRARAEC